MVLYLSGPEFSLGQMSGSFDEAVFAAGGGHPMKASFWCGVCAGSLITLLAVEARGGDSTAPRPSGSSDPDGPVGPPFWLGPGAPRR